VHKNQNTDNGETIKIMTNPKHNAPVWRHRKWPWMAMIKNSTHYLCNGILIKKNYILTTASCVRK